MNCCLFWSVCLALFILAVGRHPRNEEPCLRTGGNCIFKSNCPVIMRAETTGLCPEQEESGVVCCHEATPSDCHTRGGECLTSDQCHRAPRELGVKCQGDKVCCVLLH
ncbi:carboxypeptidase inhibitor-like [Centruroides sculpturatus]|uniref:carboxypeptidase inhibitor-like n=1 Tax=Centruroides sculpturatus TaxID=218467 RepID=UPI000C6D8662|nr:carboxypeptidase inhibitor-like [Centruroides sculpturatus]XP_023231963.1 carboxypeptidase inhibitor-like [Centruroides sculpturatus]XP_023231964.1 carboxypeptidase inhibitor-like [Centruroides sculpturatus]XP_023231965.1 carboxypeptidase inhibitor-like [Centruroides sculpturatus]